MDFLLIENLKPFSVLSGFIVVLLVVEIGLMLVGLSSNVETGGAVDGPDPDLDLDDAFTHASTIHYAKGLTADEIATLDLPPIRPQPGLWPLPRVGRRLLHLSCFGRAPALVWLTAMAAGIAACGYGLQFAMQAMTGAMLSGNIALLAVFVPGLLLGGRMTAFVARLIPSFESHAISAQTYNGRSGHVVVGVSRRGEPAQVRWRDMYGTTHSLMAEPLRDDDVIAAGAEVLIVKTKDRQPRIVSLIAS